MARTPSNMLALGTVAPQFNLLDTVSNEFKTLAQVQGKHGTVVVFICNHCPFVVHINEALVDIANGYQKKERKN